MRTPHAIALDRGNLTMQDRAMAIQVGVALVLVVADGAGGSGDGGHAADVVLEGVAELVAGGLPLDDGRTWEDFFEDLDRRIAADAIPGETTAVALALTTGWICGASVGDSEAWLVSPGGWSDLTAHQRRKPLLGSGLAMPVAFSHEGVGGVLVLGSDGLFKYARPEKIRATAQSGTPTETCAALIELTRLPGGGHQDDVAAVVCRR